MASRAAAEATSTTMMPFLYQTRTLSTLPWIRTNSNFRPRYAVRTAVSFTKVYGGLDKTGKFQSEQSVEKSRRKRQPKKTPDWDIPFDGEKKPPRSGFSGGPRGGSAIKTHTRKQLNEFGENEDGVFGESDFIDEDEGYDIFAEEDAKQEVPKSTITDRERRAFQEIFSDMFAQKPGSLDPNDRSGSKDTAKSKLDVIMAGAMVKNARSREEKEAVVNQYPLALRDSISQAIGLNDNTDNAYNGQEEDGYEQESGELEAIEEEPENIEIEHAHLEALREPERVRVETLMKEAATDFELWEVMEKEVFSLIPRLGLDKPVKEEKSKKGKKARANTEPMFKKPKDDEEAAAKFKKMVEETTNGTEAGALNTYGPLYPSYLLLAIRLLDRSFAKPSPLALSILPKIKSLGDTSRVLGASTQFYNEILRISLHRYENLAGMLETMSEMEKWAVEFDEETLDIIVEALSLSARARAGSNGDVVKVVWSRMPQFAKRGFKEWRDKISFSLAASERSSSNLG